MPLVIDASVAAAWGLADEDHPTASRAEERLLRDVIFAPSLWWFEVRNTLIVAERRGRIAQTDVGRFLTALARLPVEIDREPVEPDLLRLARHYRLTVYDAAYLELALRKGADLATLDRELISAGAAERVDLV